MAFVISGTGGISSSGLVVGEPASGAGVWESDGLSVDVGEDWTSCGSVEGGSLGLAVRDAS